MAHSPASSSSSEAPGADVHDVNPFHVAVPPMPIAASSIPLLNIKHHVPEILDLHDSNYASWSSLFELTFRKLGLVDHVDGSVDAQTRLLDVEWTQIDHCIVSWIYLTVSKTIRDMVFHRRATALSAWQAVRGLFLNNASQRTVYALQDFHNLQQGDLSVHDYCCRLKRLADTLNDVGHPITDQDLVVNLLRGLSSKFSNALGVVTAMNLLPTFLWVHSYLLQEETRVDRSHKAEAANTLLAAAGSSAGTPTGAAAAGLVATNSSSASKPPAQQMVSSPQKGGDRRKKRKTYDGRPRTNSGSPAQNPASQQQPLGVSCPWTGMVQAWQVPPAHWSAPSGVPFPRTGPPPQAMFAQAPPPPQYSFVAAPNLFTALHGQPSSTAAYTGSGDWFLDTGASSHMTGSTGIPNSQPVPPGSAHVIVGNGDSLPVTHTGALSVPTSATPLRLHHVLVCPSLVKNLISVRALTRDNPVTVEFDALGFSVKDLRTGTVLLRCDSSGDLYPLRATANVHHHGLAVTTSSRLWHARLGHISDSSFSRLLHQFPFVPV
jgi:hypothetical protein